MPVENKLSGESQWRLHPKESLTDDTPTVRNMSLSAFFLLLCGRAFLPSLRRLQEIDKFEDLKEGYQTFVPLCLWPTHQEDVGFLADAQATRAASLS